MSQPLSRRQTLRGRARCGRRLSPPPGRVISGLAVVILGFLAFPAPPAAGHASSQLPNARLTVDDRTLAVQWSAAPDDAADLGESIGLLPDGSVEAFLGTGPAEDYPTLEQERELAESAVLHEHLLEHVQLRQDGQACGGKVDPVANFLYDGARIVFTCPERVQRVVLRITLLHALDPAYRTFSGDGTVQYGLHTADHPEYTWDFAASSTDQGRVRSYLTASVAVVAFGAAGTVGMCRFARPRQRAGGRTR